jgi:TatD DNase family protein
MTTSPLVDIGANLTKKDFQDDMEGVLRSAFDKGVTAIIITGTTVIASRIAWQIATRTPDPETMRPRATALDLSQRPKLFATAGVHPHYASSLGEKAMDDLRQLARRPEVVAVGECGLDYHRKLSPIDVQRKAFEAQLGLAAELKKPVFLHDRNASADFTDILARWRSRIVGGVVHCFTGEGDVMKKYLDLDMHIGITGWICDERRGMHLRELVRHIPRGRLMVETDAPFLIPRDLPKGPGVPQYGFRNEPCLVEHVARTVARCRGETFEQLAEHTTAAARSLFSTAAF